MCYIGYWRGTTEECDECEGSGETSCDCCGNNADCNNCDSTGKVEEANSAREFIIPDGPDMKLHGHYYSLNLLHKVWLSFALLNVNKVLLITEDGKANKGGLFIPTTDQSPDDVQIIVMPIIKK